MDSGITEKLNYGWSPQDPSKTRRLKVILPQFYAALAIFAVNLSHEILGQIMYNVYHHITNASSAETLLLHVAMSGMGLLIGGIAAQITGARVIVILAGAVSAAGWIISGWVTSVTVLQCTYYITGFVKAMMQAPSFVYLAEISQPNMRNVLMAAMFLSSDIGWSFFYLSGWGNTKVAALVKIGLALFGVVVMFFLPDSPYWLANRGRYYAVESSVAWFRGRTIPENVKSESNAIIRNAQSSPTAIKLFGQKSLFIPALVVCSVFLANAFVKIFYTTYFYHVGTILYDEKYRDSFNLVRGIFTVCISIAFVILVAIIGKRMLVLISLFAGSMAILAAVFAGFLNENNTINENVYTWFVIVCLAVACCSLITGVDSVPFILNGELFPSKLRYCGAGFGLLIAHVFELVSTNLYMMYFQFAHGALLALASIFGFSLLLQLFPRNENQSLVEIEHSSTDLLKMRRIR